MQMEEALKVGFLFIPSHNFLRKTWMKRYCALYDASNHGIQRMELFETEDAYVKQSPSKIIPLTDCWKVTPFTQKQQSNVFEVRTKSNTYQFSADTFQEMTEWVVSLQTVAFCQVQKKHSVPIMSTGSGILISEEKQEENLLYCSMDEPEVYSIKAVPIEAVLRNNLKGDYKLVVTSVNFSIAEESLGKIGRVILTWPYRHIRRYGCSPDNFSFEAGRKCASGEGLFTFSTNDGMKIFQSIDSHVSALKSTQGDLDLPNSPFVREDKNNVFTTKDSLNRNDFSYSQIVNKADYPFSSHSVISGESTLSHKSSIKSLPPFCKPPRKSKSNAFNCSDKSSRVNDAGVQDSPNQYVEICTRNNTDVPVKGLEAFQTGNVSGATEGMSSNMPHSSFHSDINDVPSTELRSCFETFRINDVPSKDPKVKRAYSSNYENYDFKFENPVQCPRSAPATGHIYGKITNARQSAPSNTSNLYGSIITSSSTGASTSPVYSNVTYLKEGGNAPSSEKDLEHFLKNEAEYTQVLKKNRNPS